MLIIVYLIAIAGMSVASANRGFRVFNMAALHDQYRRSSNVRADSEKEKVTKSLQEVLEILNSGESGLDYGKARQQYENSFIKTGKFSDQYDDGWISTCTKELDVELGGGSVAINHQINELLPHHEVLPTHMYDDGYRFRVLPSYFRFNMTELHQKHQEYKQRRDSELREEVRTIAKSIEEDVKRIDMDECFRRYNEYYSNYGSFPEGVGSRTSRYTVSNDFSANTLTQNSDLLKPLYKQHIGVEHSKNIGDPSGYVYGYVKASKFM